MNVAEALPLLSGYSQAVLIFTDDDGYPFSVATRFETRGDQIELEPVETGIGPIPSTRHAQLIFCRIRPLPGVGYDQRSYVELTGSLTTNPAIHAPSTATASRGPVDTETAPSGTTWNFTPVKARGWDENAMPFFELCERAVPQARRYLGLLSAERGEPVKPKMSAGWKLFAATRAPFLTATIVPVLLGVAVAAYQHHFNWWLLVITLIGAIAVHLGLNVANDIFDTLSGADELNVTPTMFSGGSRVLQYGLVDLRGMAMIAGACYAIAIACGLALVGITGLGLLWLGLAGILISWFYTAPPLRLVHRGLGELAVALGFGPIMVLGAYFVQTRHYELLPGVLSIPVAVLVMLILYANEIPDRISDAMAGKRTLVVRMSARTVVTGYLVSAALAYVAIIAAVAAGLIPWPVLTALLTMPLAWQVARGLQQHYNSPYEVMPFLQKNVLLHLATGVLLIIGVLTSRLVS